MQPSYSSQEKSPYFREKDTRPSRTPTEAIGKPLLMMMMMMMMTSIDNPY